MRFLDIIIPQYGESAQTVEKALESIAIQKDVDFNEIGVFLINDHSKNQIKSTTLKKFPNLNITYLINEKNLGPGLTRQRGLDLSEAEYVTFLDADDVFYDDTVLNDVFLCLGKSNKPNVLYTDILWEYKDYDKIRTTVLTANDLMCLHGLFVKTSWLRNNNIRFHPNLFYYEDSYFTSVINSFNECYYNKKLAYIWKCNLNSMTKKKKYEVIVTHFDDFVNSGIYVYEFTKDINPDYAIQVLRKSIIESVYGLESNFFDYEELKDEKIRCEKLLYSVINEYPFVLEDDKFIKELSEKAIRDNEKHNYYYESYMNYYEFVDYMKKNN